MQEFYLVNISKCKSIHFYVEKQKRFYKSLFKLIFFFRQLFYLLPFFFYYLRKIIEFDNIVDFVLLIKDSYSLHILKLLIYNIYI